MPGRGSRREPAGPEPVRAQRSPARPRRRPAAATRGNSRPSPPRPSAASRPAIGRILSLVRRRQARRPRFPRLRLVGGAAAFARQRRVRDAEPRPARLDRSAAVGCGPHRGPGRRAAACRSGASRRGGGTRRGRLAGRRSNDRLWHRRHDDRRSGCRGDRRKHDRRRRSRAPQRAAAVPRPARYPAPTAGLNQAPEQRQSRLRRNDGGLLSWVMSQLQTAARAIGFREVAVFKADRAVRATKRAKLLA